MFKTSTKRFILFIFIILSIIFFDQCLKIWVIKNMTPVNIFPTCSDLPIINGILHLRYIQNPGLILGITIEKIKYWKLFFFIFKLLLIFFIICFVFKKNRDKHFAFKNQLIICGSFIAGGGIGNSIDWFFYGKYYGNKFLLCDGAPFMLCYGKVVDMIYLPFTKNLPSFIPFVGEYGFPIFNISDVFVTIGSFFMLFFIFKSDLNKLIKNIKKVYKK